MRQRWDLEVFDRNDQLVLGVEVKNKLNAPIEWASQYRRNLMTDKTLLNPLFFMFAFPDRFFLWKDVPASPEPVEPTYVVDANPIFHPYLRNTKYTADQIGNDGLEMIFSAWLGFLIVKKPEDLEPYEQWAIDSGLYEVIANGTLVDEALV